MRSSMIEQILAEEGVMVSLISGLIGSIPSALVSILTYVLTSLALYTIARRRCIRHPWLAWIPVGSGWVLGSIADQYRYVSKGEIRAKRKTLLILDMIAIVLGSAALALCAGVAVNLLGSLIAGTMNETVALGAMGSLLGGLGLLLPAAGVAIARIVIRYMALYDLYSSADPENKVLYTVFSILIGITEPLFLFLCRNKDGGMPPRKKNPDPLPTCQGEVE